MTDCDGALRWFLARRTPAPCAKYAHKPASNAARGRPRDANERSEGQEGNGKEVSAMTDCTERSEGQEGMAKATQP